MVLTAAIVAVLLSQVISTDLLKVTEIVSSPNQRGEVVQMKFGIPVSWIHYRDTHFWEHSFRHLAGMEIDAYALDNPLDPRVCLQKMLDALNEDGWEVTERPNMPIAHRMTRENDPKFWQEERGDGQDFHPRSTTFVQQTTYTFIGCDGRAKWIYTFNVISVGIAGYKPLMLRILNSIQLSKPFVPEK